jgi:hypothetical protein
MGIRCAYHVTPLYPQKLALTWPTGGSRSVGIVRGLRPWSLVLVNNIVIICNKFCYRRYGMGFDPV